MCPRIFAKIKGEKMSKSDVMVTLRVDFYNLLSFDYPRNQNNQQREIAYVVLFIKFTLKCVQKHTKKNNPDQYFLETVKRGGVCASVRVGTRTRKSRGER